VIHVAIAARLIEIYLKWTNPAIKTAVLDAAHVDAAARLLSVEFCQREPLCKLLGTTLVDVEAYFVALVRHVARQGLGVVALDADGVVRGVLSVEDHADPFVPPELTLHQDLLDIGTFLDQIPLPPDVPTQVRGRLYQCTLAATDRSFRNPKILPMMILALYRYGTALGYTHGYAKVTNKAISMALLKIEKLARFKIFRLVSSVRPADFESDGRRPFAAYQGVTSLFTWHLA
jgi:hypothetical protein